MQPEGKAYRAYFIADFVWAMAVVSEVSKGDVPPRNPFLAGDRLHYYWLADLLPAIEHRRTQQTVAIEQVLLTNALMLDLAFMAFLYFFVRHFVRSPTAAALACVAAVLFTSLEGTQRLYVYWHRHVPYGFIRNENIDAISNWKFGSLKVDGLQRLLLWQPHHATAWAISLSALLVVARQARDSGRATVNLFVGALLAVGLLLSSFLTVMVEPAADHRPAVDPPPANRRRPIAGLKSGWLATNPNVNVFTALDRCGDATLRCPDIASRAVDPRVGRADPGSRPSAAISPRSFHG